MDQDLVSTLRRWGLAIALSLGLGLILIAGLTTAYLSALLLAVGGGILAAAVLALLALPKDEFVERLWDLGVVNVFLSRAKEIPDSDWIDLIRDARHHYRAVGSAHHGYIWTEDKRKEFGEAFQAAIINWLVQVDVLWLNPESRLAVQREAEEQRDTRHDAVEAMEFFARLRDGLPENARSRLSLLEYERTPSCGIVWSDDRVIVTHYLPARADLFAPGLILRQTETIPRRLRKLVRLKTPKREQLADKYTGIYSELRSVATEITPARLAHLAELKDGFRRVASEADLRRDANKEVTKS
jgi:hypothetical protein